MRMPSHEAQPLGFGRVSNFGVANRVCLATLHAMKTPSFIALFVFGLLLSLASVASAQKPAAGANLADLAPASTAVYVEIEDPAAFIQQVETHPLRKKIEAIPMVAEALKSQQMVGLKFVMGIVNLKLGMRWQEALTKSASGGLAIVGDPATEGFALILRSEGKKDTATQKKTFDTFIELSRDDAKKKKKPFESDTYRGVEVFQLEKIMTARFDDTWVMVNNGDIGQDLVDRWKDKDKGLTSKKRFAKAATLARAGATTGWGWLDVATFRDAGLAKELFTGKTDNLLGELLFGGLLHNLEGTDQATASFNVGDEALRLKLRTPRAKDWLPEKRAWYEPEAPLTRARMPAPPETLFSIRLNRELSDFWFAAPDLYSERVQARLAKSESEVGLLFGGKDFGADILSLFGPELQLVGCRQSFATHEKHMVPAIKLPAVATVLRMRDKVKTQRELKRTFQNLVGFLNIVGAQQEKAQFEFDMEALSEGKVYFARPYISDEEMENQDATGVAGGGRMEFNASPSLAFTDDFAILSSTYELAEAILKGGVKPQAATGDAHLRAVVLGGAGKALLDDNREQLIVNEMLNKGVPKAKATTNIDLFLTLVGFLQHGRFDLDSDEDEMTMSFDLRLKP